MKFKIVLYNIILNDTVLRNKREGDKNRRERNNID